ncbi:MAG: phosphate ABC transporter permease PstA [Archaeoglobaceae archaeon]
MSLSEKLAKAGLGASASVAVIILLIVAGYLTLNGVQLITLDFLTGFPQGRLGEGGIFPQLIGSLYLTGVCLLFAVPLGVGSGIYLSEYAPHNLLTRTVRFFVECLAGIPSIVIGIFGFIIFIHYLPLQPCLLAGGLSLGFMILPWTVRTSEEAIKAVPQSYREASLALGVSKWKTIRHLVLKSAYPGILTGVLLGMGKAIGEAAVILFTAGSGLEWFLPISLFDPVGSLPVYTYMVATQGYTSDAINRAYAASFVLIIMFLVINVSALAFRNRYIKRMSGH